MRSYPGGAILSFIVVIAAVCGAGVQAAQAPAAKSAGRDAPLAVDPRGPLSAMPDPTSPEQIAEYIRTTQFRVVGPQRLRLRPFGVPQGPRDAAMPLLGGAWHGEVPKGVTPLKVDVFTSKDFYQDKDLWKDPRYFRCNSPAAIEAQRGTTSAALVDNNDPKTAPWGYCDRDLPRAALVSPYKFKTAQEHYEALLAETNSRGGPKQHTYATVPADWNGRYGVDFRNGDWYASMAYSQVPTILSLLTPEYQQRMVQQVYHEVVNAASQWPSQYCWPEGFMRRFDPVATQAQINPHFFVVTPKLVTITTGVARNFTTNINIGRQFRMEGAVPRLGADVPRWYGETIGYWDEDALITWTSNIQGWTVHGKFEFSSKMQTVEIYSPVRDAAGKITAMKHESIFYDTEALAEPIRIIRTLARMGDLDDGAPYTFIECVPNLFPVKGRSTHVSPGEVVSYEVPDMYGRPWAKTWEKYFEQGMKRPNNDEALFDFDKK